jgi:hypothetical protein
VQVVPAPIDAGSILHAAKSLQSRPFEILASPVETEEEWQALFTATFGPPHTDERKQPFPDAPEGSSSTTGPPASSSRSHTRSRRKPIIL